MAEGIFTRQIPWTRKPSYVPLLNKGHSIARGLVVALYPQSSLPVNIVDNKKTTTTSTITNGVSLEGRWISADSSQKDGFNFINPITGSQNRTMMMGARRVSNLVDNVLFYHGTNTTFNKWTIRYTSSSALRIEILGLGYNTSLVVPINTYNVIGARLDGTTLGDNTLFLNGAFEDASGATVIDTTGTAAGVFLATGAGSNAADDELFWFYFWNRALSNKEMLSIQDNPYQLLQPLIQIIPYTIAAVGGVTIMNQLQGPNIGADLYNGTIQ